ncbi:MAG: hypothetical protein AAB575_04610 [Patescibacteria group bacterium]
MTESKEVANTTENANIIPLTDLAILTDKARRIMARERRKGSKSLLLPFAELFQAAVDLDRRHVKTGEKQTK